MKDGGWFGREKVDYYGMQIIKGVGWCGRATLIPRCDSVRGNGDEQNVVDFYGLANQVWLRYEQGII